MDINKLKTIPLENIYSDIIPDSYVLHSTGGYHYFSTCSLNKNIKNIYREAVWPWIETLKNKNNILGKNRFPRPTIRDPYPKLNIRVLGSKVKYKSQLQYPTKTFYAHILVAKAFLENINNLPVVNHINSITCDYRINNLEWCSYSKNNTGKRPTIGPDKMYDIQEYRKSL